MDSGDFDSMRDKIKATIGNVCYEFWRKYCNGVPSSVTLLFASIENDTPRILSVEVCTNDIRIEEPSLGRRLVFGQIDPSISESLDDSELAYSEMSIPDGMIGINAARINYLIGTHKLTGVGRYVTSIRIDSSQTARFSISTIIPIPSAGGGEEQIGQYSVGWDSDDDMPHILDSETSEKIELRSFMQSEPPKASADLLIQV